VKRCPTCNKTFTDQHLSFCTDDGTPLLTLDTPETTPEDEATVVRPSGGANETGSGGPSRPSGSSGEGHVPPYQPPGSYIPGSSGEQAKRKAWPWILGCLGILLVGFVTLAITAKILFPGILSTASNPNNNHSNTNVDRGSNSNSNLNGSNSNAANGYENGNDNSNAEDTTPPPTDQQAVLADLKELEDEWTVANINADKKKLNRILADDYVGITEGRAQGKAEYLKTIERDTAIQHWEFEDLKVSLKGDRASLTGTLRLEVKDERGQNQNVAFRFTDKFVWRDGRWQATGSVVTPLKEEGTPA
jgi:ketosteroid isomerase-like protein